MGGYCNIFNNKGKCNIKKKGQRNPLSQQQRREKANKELVYNQ